MNRVLAIALLALCLGFGNSWAHAGADGGPYVHHGQVEAYDYDLYQVRFRAGEWAQVRLHGYGPTVLDLFVLDDNGTVVARGSDRRGDALGTWLPRYGGMFTIVVVNRASQQNVLHVDKLNRLPTRGGESQLVSPPRL